MRWYYYLLIDDDVGDYAIIFCRLDGVIFKSPLIDQKILTLN